MPLETPTARAPADPVPAPAPAANDADTGPPAAAVEVLVDQGARRATVEPVPAPEPAQQGPRPAELDVAAYQRRVYTEPRCWQLVAAVYADMLGSDPAEVREVGESLRTAARAFRLRLHKTAEGLRQVPEPADLAVVLMWATPRRQTPHCGIYWRGSVLHAAAGIVLYQDMASLRDTYPLMEYWAK